MQKPAFALAVLAISPLLMNESHAQADDLTPSETIQLLEKVEDLRKTVVEARYGIHASSIQAFRAAAESTTSAYEFYLKCYKLVKFESRDARESEYRDWKAANVKWLRSKEHSEARRLQLSYLVLTLRAAQMSKPEEFAALVPELTSHIDTCLSRYAALERKGREILHQNAVSSIFGQVYELPSTLRHLSDWGSAPLDIEGIYEKAILPHFRSEDAVSELAAAWDKRMEQSARMVGALGKPEAEIKFTERTLPQLRWEKNMDLLRAGQRSQAIKAMVELAQKNLDHEQADSWLTDLTAYLKGERDLPTFDDEIEP